MILLAFALFTFYKGFNGDKIDRYIIYNTIQIYIICRNDRLESIEIFIVSLYLYHDTYRIVTWAYPPSPGSDFPCHAFAQSDQFQRILFMSHYIITVTLILTLSTLGKDFSRCHFEIFSPDSGFETICTGNVKSFLLEKYKVNNKFNLSISFCHQLNYNREW